MKVHMVMHPCGQRIPLLLDELGVPVSMASEFLLSQHGLADLTRERNAQELKFIFQWAKDQGIDLYAMTRCAPQIPLRVIKSSLIPHLRKKLRPPHDKVGNLHFISKRDERIVAVSDAVFNSRLYTASNFFKHWFDDALDTIQDTSPKYKIIQDYKNSILEYLASKIVTVRSNKRQSKALSEFEMQSLAEIVKSGPTSASSEFIKLRNKVVVGLQTVTPARAGEVLSLHANDIIFGHISQINFVRRPPDPDDLRNPRPALKTNGRPVEVSNAELLKDLDDYLMMRETLMETAKANHPYLVITEQARPLSYWSLRKIYTDIRAEHPRLFRVQLNAKALRHTFTTHLENALRELGIGEERRRKHLAAIRGDSSRSSQDKYLDAAFDAEYHQAMRKVQDTYSDCLP